MNRLGFTQADLQRIDVHELLAQVGGYYRLELGDFETMMWTRAISLYGDMAVKRFLVHHIETAEQFFPKVGEFFKFIDPGSSSAISAFEEVREQVARCGPWRSPSFKSQAVVLAIQAMGGWVQVNKELPSPEHDRFGYEAFFKRFEAALNVANSELALTRGAPSERLLGLHSLKAVSGAPALQALEMERSHELQPLIGQAPRKDVHR